MATSRTLAVVGAASALVPFLFGTWACSAGVKGEAEEATGGAGGVGPVMSTGGTVGTSGGVPSSGTGSSPAGTGSMGPIDFGGQGGKKPDDIKECAGTAKKAENIEVPVEIEITTLLPFDMFIIYDQSGSMNDDTPVGTRWDAIKSALTGFVNDPTSAGIGVGIQYFPFVNPAAPPVCFADADCKQFGPCVPVIFVGYCAGADACLPAQYNTPDVPIEALPAVAPKIVASVNRHRPGGGTPTTPALAGALEYAKPWAAAHPDKKTIVVLATDGDPSGCNANTVNDVAAAAASGLAANPPVKTFVIGVGSSLTSLNAIAAAGGTQQALIVDAANGDPKAQFLAAMNKIRDSVTTKETRKETQQKPLPCDYAIPPPPETEKFDKEKVNVDFAAGTNPAQRIGAVKDAAACASAADGWYYDNEAEPTKVLICPQTCQRIQSTKDASVSVAFGCATQRVM
jgi:hypothetical protein